MLLDSLIVGPEAPPVIVAEMSGNHNHSLERALDILEAAASAGVKAFKLQTYTPETLTVPGPSSSFLISEPHSPWAGRTLHDLYQSAYTPWEWHEKLFRRGRELGMVVFSSPFDESAVDFLETLNCPCYKIASFENVHLPLIRKVASTGKPVIMSTGLASLVELCEAVETARQAGCARLALLKCTSAYPAPVADLNLRTLPHLRELFQVEVGLSDHTLTNTAAITAVAMGACLIEKHFTLRRADGGVDSAFSCEPDEMAELVTAVRDAWSSLGSVRYGVSAGEQSSLQFRPSLYARRGLEAGEILRMEDVRVARPNLGLPPRQLQALLGRPLRVRVLEGTPLDWEMV